MNTKPSPISNALLGATTQQSESVALSTQQPHQNGFAMRKRLASDHRRSWHRAAVVKCGVAFIAVTATGSVSAASRTSQVRFTHPSWGKVRLMAGPLDEASPTGNDAATIKVIDTRGRVRWKYSNTSLMYDLSVAGSSKYASKVRTALDKSGNVFLDYNPGRYNGVIVLRPVAGGFANFRTLPTPGDFNGRFYFAELSDADSDGTYEIISSSNDCTPSCAEGTTTSTVWRWNGHDYVTG